MNDRNLSEADQFLTAKTGEFDFINCSNLKNDAEPSESVATRRRGPSVGDSTKLVTSLPPLQPSRYADNTEADASNSPYTGARSENTLYDAPTTFNSTFGLSVLYDQGRDGTSAAEGLSSRHSVTGIANFPRSPNSNRNSITQTPGVLSRRWSESTSALFHPFSASVQAQGGSTAALDTAATADDDDNDNVDNSDSRNIKGSTRIDHPVTDHGTSRQGSDSLDSSKDSDYGDDVVDIPLDGNESNDSPDTALVPYISYSDKSLNGEKASGTAPARNDDTRALKALQDSYKRYKLWTVCILSVVTILLLLSLAANAYLGFLYFNPARRATSTIKLGSQVEAPITIKDADVAALLNDTNLHHVFYGIDYTPGNSQYPKCGVTQKDVSLDLAVLSQLTSRIRLYSTDCNQTDYVLRGIQDLGLNMTVSIGVWAGASTSSTQRQLTEMTDILAKYPHRYIDSILIGHEALYRNELTNEDLISCIDYTKDYLRNQSIDSIKVGTSDIGFNWSAELAEHADILAVSLHPFFGALEVHESIKWTYDFLMKQIDLQVPANRNLRYIISEVGWPSGGGSIEQAVAGVDELQAFLDKWVCDNQNPDIGWYWFEAFDETRKAFYDNSDQKWESHWGLFTKDRKLKDIKIPTCKDEGQEPQ